MSAKVALVLALTTLLTACRYSENPANPAAPGPEDLRNAGSPVDSPVVIIPAEEPPLVCTLIECVAPLVIEFDRPISDYKVFVSDGGWQDYQECRITSPEPDEAAYPGSAPCGRNRVIFHPNQYRQKSPTGTLLILGDCNQTLFQGEIAFNWEGDRYPNGKACDVYPCQTGKVKVSLAAGSSSFSLPIRSLDEHAPK